MTDETIQNEQDFITVVYFECLNCTAFNGHIKKGNTHRCNFCGEIMDIDNYCHTWGEETIHNHGYQACWYRYYINQEQETKS